jgi:serine/threonine-protein kinase
MGTLMARVGSPLPPHPALGPLDEVLARAAAPQATARLDAAGFAARLGALASALPSPAPLPLLTPDHQAPAPINVFRPPGVSELTQVAPLGPTTGPTGPVRHSGTMVPPGATPLAPVGTRAGPGEIFDAEPLASSSSARAESGGLFIAPDRRSRRKVAWAIGIAAAVLILVAGALVAIEAKVFTPSYKVPTLVDLTMSEARTAAAKGHFTLHIEPAVKSITVGNGSIVSQSPAAGTSLKGGSTLNVVPSQGPPPVMVPSLVGLTCAQAIAALTPVHLKGLCAPPRYDDTTPTGQLVIWSIGSTANPSRAPYGSTITLVPSEGHSPVLVPTIPTSYTCAQAQAALQAVGLTATQATTSSSSVATGDVVSTTPSAGAMAPYGSAVTVTTSSGPPTVSVPNVYDDTVPQAASTLEAAGLTVSGLVGNPTGTVVGTEPSQGSSVPTGSSVEILAQ